MFYGIDALMVWVAVPVVGVVAGWLLWRYEVAQSRRTALRRH